MFFLTAQFRSPHKLQTHREQKFWPSVANRLPTHTSVRQLLTLMLHLLPVEAPNTLDATVVYSVLRNMYCPLLKPLLVLPSATVAHSTLILRTEDGVTTNSC